MPEPFLKFRGKSVSILRDNIDTDQIIPSKELRSDANHNYSESLFAGWRYSDIDKRIKTPDFILNHSDKNQASCLVTGHNFGCGSSREHAVWALRDFGFRVIIAKSFGVIFYNNCIRNGILPIVFPSHESFSDNDLTKIDEYMVDLLEQEVTSLDARELRWKFDIKPYHKQLLIEGLNPIDLTLQDKGKIEAFYYKDRSNRPWLYSGRRVNSDESFR